jgi:hypothetical protein
VTVLGVVIVLGGVVSVVAGVTGRRRSRRIRGEGETAWATIVPAPRHPEYEPSAYRPLLRFRTSDGRAVEVFSPLPPTRGRPLVEGQKVLVYFDPAEPTQVLLHAGRERADIVFIVLGAVAIVGAVVAVALV